MIINFDEEEVIITYDGLQIVIQEDNAKELANAILEYFEEEQLMNKEEIKKAIKVALNETCKECYFPKRKCTSCVRDNEKKIKKYIKELEQKESILDKVIDKLKEYLKQIKQDGIYGYDTEIREILNIIEGEKK